VQGRQPRAATDRATEQEVDVAAADRRRQGRAAQLLRAVRDARPGRRRLGLLRLRRGRSGSGMAVPPVALDPGEPSRPPPALASLVAARQGRLDVAGAGGGPLPQGRVEGDGMARAGATSEACIALIHAVRSLG
jgi:hypothetical protein